MTTMNISVPDEMKAFVESKMAQEGYASASEYLRTLIREAQRQQAKQGLEAKLREALESGPATPMKQEDWAALRQEAMDGLAGENHSSMSQIVRRPAANRDLVTIYQHYARHAGLRVADRFFAEAEATFTRLADMPGLGTRYEPSDALYVDLRYFPVSRFRVYLVFYRPIPSGIEVFRVLHSARDIDGILTEEFGIEEAADDDQPEANDE